MNYWASCNIPNNAVNWSKFLLLLYIVLTISILIGQEPPAYFKNLSDFLDKHDYSIICQITCPNYTACSAYAKYTYTTTLAKGREHLNDCEWLQLLGVFVLVFIEAQIKSTCISHNGFCIFS